MEVAPSSWLDDPSSIVRSGDFSANERFGFLKQSGTPFGLLFMRPAYPFHQPDHSKGFM